MLTLFLPSYKVNTCGSRSNLRPTFPLRQLGADLCHRSKFVAVGPSCLALSGLFDTKSQTSPASSHFDRGQDLAHQEAGRCAVDSSFVNVSHVLKTDAGRRWDNPSQKQLRISALVILYMVLGLRPFELRFFDCDSCGLGAARCTLRADPMNGWQFALCSLIQPRKGEVATVCHEHVRPVQRFKR